MPHTTPFWMGGVAASMASCFTHPLDFVKVRMQTLDTSRKSVSSVVRYTVAESGFVGLYVGLSASVLRQMTYSLVRFSSYETIKNWIADGRKPTAPELLLSAGIAGAMGGVVGNPADVVLVRMITTGGKAHQPFEERYRNALQGVYKLVKDNGLQGLTSGLSANITRAILMAMSQLASYDFFKERLLQTSAHTSGLRIHDGLLLHVMASTMAGMVATTITAPADVIKSRLMASPSKASPIEVILRSARQEGAGVFFRGWVPAFLRLGPNTVLLFVFLEQMKSQWAKMKHHEPNVQNTVHANGG